MAKKNFFAVKSGRKTGIFTDWSECRESIKGYAGQEFRGFNTLKEAQDYIDGVDLKMSAEKEAKENCIAIAYIGSEFSEKLGKCSFGYVIIEPNGEITKNTGITNNQNYIISREISGRILGTIEILKYIMEKGYNEIIIRSNSDDIEKLATRKWESKSQISKEFMRFIKENEEKIDIRFEKVVDKNDATYSVEVQKMASKELVDCKQKEVKKSSNSCFIAEGIKKEDLETAIELFIEDNQLNGKIKINNIDMKDESSQYSIKVSADNCVIKHYNKTNKVMIQGKPNIIFSTISSYIIELVDTDKLPQIFNSYYNIDIKDEQVIELYNVYLPHIPNDINNKVKNHLLQSVYNLILQGEVYEAAYLIYPSLRVTEGIIKGFLIENNIGYDDKFDMFIYDTKTRKYKLNKDSIKGVKKDNTISCIEELYTFFNNQRHSLFHWGDVEPIDTTREIKTINEAQILIKENLRHIDKYYEQK